jgi:hypothetical protein
MSDGITDGFRMEREAEKRDIAFSRLLKLLLIRKSEQSENEKVAELAEKFNYREIASGEDVSLTNFTEEEEKEVKKLLSPKPEIGSWVNFLLHLFKMPVFSIKEVLGAIFYICPFPGTFQGIGEASAAEDFTPESGCGYYMEIGDKDLIQRLTYYTNFTVFPVCKSKRRRFIVFLHNDCINFFFES